MAKIIDGKQIAAQIKEEVRQQAEQMKQNGQPVCLAVVIVGENPASKVYVRNKEKDCAEVGFESREYALGEDTTQEQLLELVETLNKDDSVHGILVQLPLPKQIDERAVIQAISPDKDVDAFHESNVGRIMIGDYRFLPCTPSGCLELIHSTGVSVEGKHCVVIGRSNIVGKPMAMMMLHESATVTVCHSKTENLKEICRQADILIAAVGKAGLVTADMVKPGAVVIDVGMNRNQQGKLCGDVDYDGVSQVAGYITPVPGGVGPMTRAVLMKNTLTAAKIHYQK